jgi:hypothetical protein
MAKTEGRTSIPSTDATRNRPQRCLPSPSTSDPSLTTTRAYRRRGPTTCTFLIGSRTPDWIPGQPATRRRVSDSVPREPFDARRELCRYVEQGLADQVGYSGGDSEAATDDEVAGLRDALEGFQAWLAAEGLSR